MNIYSITWNDELMLPQWYKWYKNKFPNAFFTIYDNMSTDKTLEIAKELNIRIITYNTNEQHSETEILKIKNNCWKLGADWCIISDLDEWLDIDESFLDYEHKKGTTIIKTIGWNMCNKDDIKDLQKIKTGVRSVNYDKLICFRTSKIKEINFGAGSHFCKPVGEVVYSEKKYPLLHIKFFNEQYLVDRYKLYNTRRSQEMIRNGWGFHYAEKEEKIRANYKNHLISSINIYSI